MKKNIIIFIILLILVSVSLYLYNSFREEKNTNINITENIGKKDDIKVEINKNLENNNAIKPYINYGYGLEDNKTDVTKSQIILNEDKASENCLKVGGVLKKEKTGKGTEFGVCYFKDGKACEEWALMNKNCPIGGIDTSMYNLDSEKLCLWLGGTIDKENDTCLFKNITCKINDLYNEKCLPVY